MGQTPEWIERRTNSYPIIDLNMEGVEVEGEKHVVWENEAEKRKISYIVLGGGSWQSVWTKILILSSTDPLVGSEMMRVEISKDGDTGEINKAVFVDTFKFEEEVGKAVNFVYELGNEGRREESGHVYQISEGEVYDYLETLKDEMVRTRPDLPEQIDVEETIRLFLEQVEERRMSMPVLIAI